MALHCYGLLSSSQDTSVVWCLLNYSRSAAQRVGGASITDRIRAPETFTTVHRGCLLFQHLIESFRAQQRNVVGCSSSRGKKQAIVRVIMLATATISKASTRCAVLQRTSHRALATNRVAPGNYKPTEVPRRDNEMGKGGRGSEADRKVAIFGASGFLGPYVCTELGTYFVILSLFNSFAESIILLYPSLKISTCLRFLS